MKGIYNIKLKGFDTPRNHDEFIKLLKKATKEKYQSLSRFSMMNGTCTFLHTDCGKTFRRTPYNLLIKGDGCGRCNDKIDISYILRHTQDNELDIDLDKDASLDKHADFADKLYDKYGDEYVALECYQTPSYKIKIIHTKCKTTFERSPDEILNNIIKCPKCNPKIQWTMKKVKDKITKITKGEFKVVTKKYVNIDTPIEIKHTVCGGVFMDSPNSFMKTPKCKLCESNISLNEKRIKNFFMTNNIQFSMEYNPKNCRLKNPLKFDFAIFKNEKLICLLEFDGEQHYRPVFDKESFLRTQQSDIAKNKFCYENNIKLIRIPFWEKDNLNKILREEMKLLKLL